MKTGAVSVSLKSGHVRKPGSLWELKINSMPFKRRRREAMRIEWGTADGVMSYRVLRRFLFFWKEIARDGKAEVSPGAFICIQEYLPRNRSAGNYDEYRGKTVYKGRAYDLRNAKPKLRGFMVTGR